MHELLCILRVVLALLALLLGGCTGTVYELDQRWAPLERIREAEVPGLGDEMIATVYTEVLTRDLAELLRAAPPGSVELEGILLHEQVHAKRQFADPTFFARYAASRSFRWEEEKLGWAIELRFLRANGRQIDVETCAHILSSKYGHMVTRDEARKWVQEQLR